MKKILAIILSMSVVTTALGFLSGCSKKDRQNIESGGWGKPSSPVITEEIRTMFEKATETLTGESFEPVAYLASQIVAGRNYLLLCKGTPTVPDAETTYALVYVYEDLSGNAKITSITDSDIPAIVSTTELAGGWHEAENLEVTEEIQKALKKASKTLTGESYNPVALLGSQVVAGNNYAVLCGVEGSSLSSSLGYAVVYIYVDLKGNAEITDVKYFTANTENEENEQIANPVAGYEKLDEAEKAVGFTISITGIDEIINYSVIGDEILEIEFKGGYLRKAKGSDDISGDYNEYEFEKTAEADGKKVTVKGNGEKAILALWSEGEYTYCLSFADGVNEADMLKAVSGIN